MRFSSRRRPSVVVAVVVAVVAMVVAGCGGGAAAGSSSDSTVKWGVKSIQANWDPIVTGSTGATVYLTPIYESLFTVDGERNVVPALASGYEYNPAGDQITVRLKPGLTFQDGSPVDAEAVRFNVERIKSQENSALKGSYNNVKAATVVDPLTVRLDLGQQDYQIPYLLAVRGGMLPSKVAAQANPGRLNTAAPVGAGPFKVVSYDPESKIVLEKWDGYWDAANIEVDRIEISFGIDPSTLVAGLQSGVYNRAQLDPQLADEAKKAGFDVLADTDRQWASTFLSLNANVAPFTDPAVREAVRYAINPDEFTTKLTFGLGLPSHQPYPQGHPSYVSALDSEYRYDPAKARDILAKAGYADGAISFDLNGVAGNFEQAAELVQGQLKAVGITANITLKDQANWGKGYFGKQQAASIYGWVGRDSHVQGLTEHFDTGGVLNLSSPTTSPQFQEALKVVRATPIDSPDYEAKLKAAARAGYENGTTVSLYTSPTVVAKDKLISDPPAIDGYQSWKGVQFTPGSQ